MPFSEAGAGIQIGPNGMRVLELLGADRTLRAVAVEPLEIRVVDGLGGAELPLPLGGWIAERHGAPCCVAHARTCRTRSWRGCARSRSSRSRRGSRSPPSERAGRVEVTSSTGEAVQGARSSPPTGCGLRSARLGAPPLPHATRIAARTVIAAERVADAFRVPAIWMWLAPGRMSCTTRCAAGPRSPVVAIFESGWRGQDWATPAERELLLDKLATRRRFGFLAATGDWRKWSLFDAPPLPCWSRAASPFSVTPRTRSCRSWRRAASWPSRTR